MGVPHDLNGGVTYGMLQSAIIQALGKTNEEAADALDWYDGVIPDFADLDRLSAFAVQIYVDYREAQDNL